jgi:uncharacterized protein (DUF885 family)
MSDADRIYQSYFDLRWHFNPAAATESGIIAQNERLGDYDVDSMRAHLAAFRSLSLAVEELEPDDVEAEIDRTALLSEIRSTLFRFQHEQPHIRNPTFWLSHLYNALYGLLDRQDAPPHQLAAAGIARLRAAPAFLAAAVATLREPAPILVETAASMIEGGEILIGMLAAFCREHMVGEEADVAAAEAEAALARFGVALKTELATSEDDQAFAIGEEQFNRRLHFEYALTGSAPELWRYGLHLVEEVEANLVQLARSLDGGVSWRMLAERLRQEFPIGNDPVSACRGEMEQARAFVDQREIVSLPPALLEVVPTPVFLRPLIPFAAYSPPGAFSADRTGRFFVTPWLPGYRRPANRSAAELASMVIHEGYPGHHLHMLTSQELPSLVRRVVWSPLTVEGWALYCEDMMGEEGYYQDPSVRFFQQIHLLWRAVRVILDVGLHTRGMSPDAAIVYLLDKVPITHAEAVAEVRRYCGSPGYQICYAVGRREILSLREDYRIRAGVSYSLRGFHDALLAYGGLPVSLARWGMGLQSNV